MHVAADSTPSRFSLWLAMEARTDVWVSYGALAVGLSAFALLVLL